MNLNQKTNRPLTNLIWTLKVVLPLFLRALTPGMYCSAIWKSCQSPWRFVKAKARAFPCPKLWKVKKILMHSLRIFFHLWYHYSRIFSLFFKNSLSEGFFLKTNQNDLSQQLNINSRFKKEDALLNPQLSCIILRNDQQ